MRHLLIGIVFAGLVLLPGCRKREAEHARVDDSLAPLLPGDTAALACLRLDRLKGTPFYAKYVAGKRIKALEEFARTTGLDPRENIWELVFSTNGHASYVFIRGKFGGEFGFEPDFKTNGLVRSNYKGHYLIYLGDSGVVYMNSGAAVAGKVEDLRSLVDGFDSPKRTAPQALLDLVATLPGTSHLWAASLQPSTLVQLGDAPGLSEGPFGTPSNGMSANLARIGRRVSQVTLWGDLSQGLEMHVSAVAGSASDAAQLRDVFQAGTSMGRLSVQDSQPDMLKLYDGLSAVADGAVVRIDVKEPFELLDSVLASLWPAGAGPKK
jgi:hypothetical protein